MISRSSNAFSYLEGIVFHVASHFSILKTTLTIVIIFADVFGSVAKLPWQTVTGPSSWLMHMVETARKPKRESKKCHPRY